MSSVGGGVKEKSEEPEAEELFVYYICCSGYLAG